MNAQQEDLLNAHLESLPENSFRKGAKGKNRAAYVFYCPTARETTEKFCKQHAIAYGVKLLPSDLYKLCIISSLT